MQGSRDLFATRLGVIATTVGSAVGLGNIWRFPYEAGVHGGAAFLLLYIGFIVLLGIPVLTAEFALGRANRQGIFGAFKRMEPHSPWRNIGYLGVVAAMMILSFYSVVAGWTLEYFVGEATGSLSAAAAKGAETEAYHSAFAEFTSGWRAVMWTVVFLLINYAVIVRGVKSGIERVSNVLTPLLLLLIIAFCINSLMLPGAREGLAFLFHPDFSQLTPSVVIGAMGQAFFSLSLGLGTMLTYASYFGSDTNLIRSASITAGLDTLIAILAGILIFPAVFTYGFSPAEGPLLIFEVLPEVFAQMPGGRIWSTFFFFMLFLASVTSTISMAEVVVAYLVEVKEMRRSRASLLTIAVALVLGVVCALSFGRLGEVELPLVGRLNVFGWFDYATSNILLPLGGMLISIYAGWRMKRSALVGVLASSGGCERHLIRAIIFVLRWIAPLLIAIVFVVNL